MPFAVVPVVGNVVVMFFAAAFVVAVAGEGDFVIREWLARRL